MNGPQWLADAHGRLRTRMGACFVVVFVCVSLAYPLSTGHFRRFPATSVGFRRQRSPRYHAADDDEHAQHHDDHTPDCPNTANGPGDF